MNVGMLIPYSGLFSNMGQEMEKGLRLGTGLLARDQLRVSTSYIDPTRKSSFLAGIDQLQRAGDLALIMAMMPSKDVNELEPVLQQLEVPVVFLQLEARGSFFHLDLPHVFFNSLHLHSSQFVLGNFVEELLGQDACVSLGSCSASCSEGRLLAAHRDNEGIHRSAIKYLNTSEDVIRAVQLVKEKRPFHVHVLTSSKSTFVHFLKEIKREKLHDTVRISFVPFFSEADHYRILEVSTKSLFSASTWFKEVDNEANRQFVSTFQDHFGSSPEGLALLAYEVGLQLQAAKTQDEGRKELLERLAYKKVTGPRGQIDLKNTSGASKMVYVSKIAFGRDRGALKREIISIEEGQMPKEYSID